MDANVPTSTKRAIHIQHDIVDTSLLPVEKEETKSEPDGSPTYVEAYRGYGKMVEEAGELTAELGKLLPFPMGAHPNGKGPVLEHVLEEMADLYAAMDYFLSANQLTLPSMRREKKFIQFNEWGLSGLWIASTDAE